MRQYEDKFKRKASHFRLPSMAKKRRVCKLPDNVALQLVSRNAWHSTIFQAFSQRVASFGIMFKYTQHCCLPCWEVDEL